MSSTTASSGAWKHCWTQNDARQQQRHPHGSLQSSSCVMQPSSHCNCSSLWTPRCNSFGSRPYPTQKSCRCVLTTSTFHALVRPTYNAY